MKVLPKALAAFLALAVLVSQPSSDEDTNIPLKVVVRQNAGIVQGAAVPVEFLAPLNEADAGSPFSSFLVSMDGLRSLCQVELLGPSEADSGYRWARLTSLLPPGDAVYFFRKGGVALPEDVAAVSSVITRNNAALDTGAVTATFDPMKFHILDSVQLLGKPLVPRFIEGLVNRQQGLSVGITDIIRHVDFTLRPESECAFTAEGSGPVSAGVRYEGRLSGEESLEPVPYSSRIRLFANGIIGVEVRLDSSSLDPQRFSVSAVRIVLPVILEQASSLSFGADAAAGSTRANWEGKASLSVGGDGSYRIADADGSEVTGRGPVEWASYCDGRRGLGIVWDGAVREVELGVDFNEDLIDFAAVPKLGADGSALVRLYILPHGEENAADMLNSISISLANPPTATVSDAYIRAITGVE